MQLNANLGKFDQFEHLPLNDVNKIPKQHTSTNKKKWYKP